MIMVVFSLIHLGFDKVYITNINKVIFVFCHFKIFKECTLKSSRNYIFIFIKLQTYNDLKKIEYCP